MSVESPPAWPPALPGWRATGLSLAPISAAAFGGVAALCASVIAVVMIFAFARLHHHYPDAVSTGDLVASTVGPAAGRFAGLLQLTAYVLLGVAAALALALQPLTGAPDLESALAGWWWPGWAVMVVVIAGAVVAYLPTRAVGATAAALAGVGLLVVLYLALAIVARVASGTPPMALETTEVDSVLVAVAAAIPLGLGLVGFEAATVVSGRLQSVARPVGVAVTVIALCAAALLLAVNVGTSGGFHTTATDLSLVVYEFFADAGYYWFTAGVLCLSSATLLALMWAATRVAARLFGSGPLVATVVPAVMCVLAVGFSRFQHHLGGLQHAVPALLLVVVYVLVAEANSRVAGTAAAQQVPRLMMTVVVVCVVLIPLRVTDFAVSTLWPLAVTAALLAVAAALTRLGRPGRQAPLTH
ncbi:hypothetical protein [[Mycobacterium] fortunisiensis]|uniref:hypothetical protein n=1 Tax=[Mycobacterium] fortunisiensis TaxID=2600579 RepID=UPI0027E1F43A|nr:hypothetical protein [[Mycobacterium] fortunisiensis]